MSPRQKSPPGSPRQGQELGAKPAVRLASRAAEGAAAGAAAGPGRSPSGRPPRRAPRRRLVEPTKPCVAKPPMANARGTTRRPAPAQWLRLSKAGLRPSRAMAMGVRNARPGSKSRPSAPYRQPSSHWQVRTSEAKAKPRPGLDAAAGGSASAGLESRERAWSGAHCLSQLLMRRAASRMAACGPA